MTKLTLLAAFAHPDDEAFGSGGTLSRYAAEGCDVYLVTATRGEAGEIAPGVDAVKANLPAVRERELRAACEAYGIHPPRLLDYVDGQMAIVHQGQAVGKLTRIIRELRPQVVITFGPDGIYGHYDHIAIHRWTTIAVELAAQPDCFPEQLDADCRPHQVAKLYYRALSAEQLAERAAQGRAAVMMDGVPFAFVGYGSDYITTQIDVSAYAERKLRGIQCHLTQIGLDSPFLRDPQQALRQPSFTVETFHLASSTVGSIVGGETDLFAGLR